MARHVIKDVKQPVHKAETLENCLIYAIFERLSIPICRDNMRRTYGKMQFISILFLAYSIYGLVVLVLIE